MMRAHVFTVHWSGQGARAAPEGEAAGRGKR